jgi:hypothetical protein
MLFNKLTLVAAGFSMMLWTPAFAGHSVIGDGNSHGHELTTSGNATEANGHHGRSNGQGHRVSHNMHGNKGGAQRGLDRADQVAASHGEEGRDNASTHHSSDTASPHDNDE